VSRSRCRRSPQRQNRRKRRSFKSALTGSHPIAKCDLAARGETASQTCAFPTEAVGGCSSKRAGNDIHVSLHNLRCFNRLLKWKVGKNLSDRFPLGSGRTGFWRLVFRVLEVCQKLWFLTRPTAARLLPLRPANAAVPTSIIGCIAPPRGTIKRRSRILRRSPRGRPSRPGSPAF